MVNFGDYVQPAVDRVCKSRGLPSVLRSSKCEVDGKTGKIWGGNHSSNFLVKFDDPDHNGGRIAACHPYYMMRIFNKDGSILYESEDLR